MKIVYILRSFALMAGLERVEADKMNWLAEHGFDVTLITYEQGEHPVAFPLQNNIQHINIEACFFKLRNYSLPVRLYRTIRLRKRFKRGFKQFVDSKQPDIIVITTDSLKVIGDVLSVKGNARTVIESHQNCSTVTKKYDYRNSPLMKMIATLYDAQTFRQIRKCDCLVTLTQGDADEWRKHAENIIVIPNPVTRYPDVVKQHDGRGKRIISVGRLEKEKGFDMLIDAFSMFTERCPGWKLYIFGKGSQEKELHKQIKRLNLEWYVRINAPTNSLYEEYQKSEFYVLSSRYEGFGLVLLEAMSCGIPCVAFNCKYGPAGIIDDGRSGLLAENGNVRELAEKMIIMAADKEERLRMGIEARKQTAKYKKDNIMQKWIELLGEYKGQR